MSAEFAYGVQPKPGLIIGYMAEGGVMAVHNKATKVSAQGFIMV